MIRRAVGLSVCAAAVVYSQTAAPRFEVASVKPSSATGNSGGHSGNGRLTMTGVTLRRCMIGAYGIGPNQIVGGPDWLDTDHFEILAKADRPAGDTELMRMLQTLLAERFKLAIHRETRPVQVFALEVARNGPKLEKAEGGEHKSNSRRGGIDARNTTMDYFAGLLSRQMELPVVNHTDLEGIFNLQLSWMPASDKPDKPGAAAAVPEGPSIFTAIQEQLGLRLRAQKAPLEVLVIDHAERPSEN